MRSLVVTMVALFAAVILLGTAERAAATVAASPAGYGSIATVKLNGVKRVWYRRWGWGGPRYYGWGRPGPWRPWIWGAPVYYGWGYDPYYYGPACRTWCGPYRCFRRCW